jgi:probable F420-dependent oxidoreductase
MVRLGVVFPQSEIEEDPVAVRAYAEAAEELGYAHILAFDHVVGADLTNRPDWTGPYNVDTQFHEVFVLFGYLAAITRSVELVTGVLILPQRQAVLVAKQAAEVDVLSHGRMRLGVGIGWNEVEYEALNENFRNRGARSAEQVRLMKRLWTERSVTFDGRYHHVDAAGILPMPVQQPIPVWFGGYQEATIRRIVEIGDGWICTAPPEDRIKDLRELLDRELQRVGRDASSIGIEGSISYGGGEDAWTQRIDAWRELGATHLCVNTMNAGLRGAQAHIDAIRRFKETVGEI